MTPEEIKADWLEGLYTPSGYLYALIKALGADLEIYCLGSDLTIRTAKAFCERWEISQAAFYRAKAKLISQGRINKNLEII